MTWEDTILTDKQMAEALDTSNDEFWDAIGHKGNPEQYAQGEVSFKAGFVQAFKEMLGLPKDMKVYKSENIVDEESYKAGMREVAKWIEENATDIFADYLARSQKWQAFKEEKGI